MSDNFLKRITIWSAMGTLMLGVFAAGQQIGIGSVHAFRELHWMLAADNGKQVALKLGLDPQTNNVPPADIFSNVVDYVHLKYVRGYGGDQTLSDGALSGLVASLDDPYTSFLNPDMGAAQQSALRGHYQGIGAVLTITRRKLKDVTYRYLTVMSVLPDSPAANAGIQSGDHITDIDGHWIIAYSIIADVNRISIADKNNPAAARKDMNQVATHFKSGYSLTRAISLLSEGTGKSYHITLTRTGTASPIQRTLTTRDTQVRPISLQTLPGDIGRLTIHQFNEADAGALSRTILSAAHLKGLIIDLRQNRGGMEANMSSGDDGFQTYQTLISLLTPGGKAAVLEEKPGHFVPVQIKRAPGALHLPMIVLVDRGTSGIAEMAAAALRSLGNAKIMGAHTFGDGILQYFAPLSSGACLEIATAHVRTDENQNLSLGITPAYPLPPSQLKGEGAVASAARILKS